jgi:N-acyl-D-amino-acid deacylase
VINKSFDKVIRNDLIIDGSGKAEFKADVGINNDRIVAIGDLSMADAHYSADATGLIVAPGFIDVHTHDDASLIIRPKMEAKLSQGVTTVICGNCGISGAPYDLQREPPGLLRLVFKSEEFVASNFKTFIAKVRAAQPSVNSAFLTGHTTLRMNAMGDDLNRPATPSEIKFMQNQLESSLKEGSIGLSTGLFYEPAYAAPTSEIIEIAKILAAYGGIYTTHMRNEGDYIVESLEEAILIGSEAGVPIVISHHKCQGEQNFGRSIETLKIMEKARKNQLVALDVYPYEASSTVLNRNNVENALKTLITWSDPHPEMSGRYINEIAAEFDLSVLDTLEKLSPGGAIYFMMDENDIERIMTSENAMIGSDGLPEDEHPHPRLWGTFPRVLGRYVREKKIMPLHNAVHRMTGLSARNFKLKNRGLIKVNYFADITIFDPNDVIDKATYENPKQLAAGIVEVFVNGQLAWKDGQVSSTHSGQVIMRQVTL